MMKFQNMYYVPMLGLVLRSAMQFQEFQDRWRSSQGFKAWMPHVSWEYTTLADAAFTVWF